MPIFTLEERGKIDSGVVISTFTYNGEFVWLTKELSTALGFSIKNIDRVDKLLREHNLLNGCIRLDKNNYILEFKKFLKDINKEMSYEYRLIKVLNNSQRLNLITEDTYIKLINLYLNTSKYIKETKGKELNAFIKNIKLVKEKANIPGSYPAAYVNTDVPNSFCVVDLIRCSRIINAGKVYEEHIKSRDNRKISIRRIAKYEEILNKVKEDDNEQKTKIVSLEDLSFNDLNTVKTSCEKTLEEVASTIKLKNDEDNVVIDIDFLKASIADINYVLASLDIEKDDIKNRLRDIAIIYNALEHNRNRLSKEIMEAIKTK